MKKVVVKVQVHDEREKRKALRAVSGLQGVDSISLDLKDQKLSVTGDIDPVDVVNKLRKLYSTEILSVGPAKEPEKKDEPKKKKDEMEEFMKAWTHMPYPPRVHVIPPYVYPMEEDPNSCVIC